MKPRIFPPSALSPADDSAVLETSDCCTHLVRVRVGVRVRATVRVRVRVRG